jgi:hypothetical protein
MEVAWAVVKRRAATDPAWVWHHPRALDALRDELVKRDMWRLNGTFVERGPFPQPAPTVSVQVLNRNEDTGETTLRVRPLHADAVLMSDTGPPSPMSDRLDQFDITTKAVRLWFLAVDSNAASRSGEPVPWAATITVKHKLYQDGTERRCELRAIPAGDLRYTVDGSGPETQGSPYEGPFVIPDATRVVLAIAEADGLRSEVARFDVPADGTGGVVVDANRAATWRRAHKRDATSGSYSLLEAAGRNNAELGGVVLTVAHDNRWAEFRVAEDVFLSPEAVIDHANRLKEIIADGNLDLEVAVLRFESGTDLSGLVRDLKTELRPGEVVQ